MNIYRYLFQDVLVGLKHTVLPCPMWESNYSYDCVYFHKSSELDSSTKISVNVVSWAFLSFL